MAAPRQCDVVGVVLGATDYARLIPHRKTHHLLLVKLGILERRQTNQPIGQWLRELCLLEIDQVGQRHRKRLRHRPDQLLADGCGSFPRFLLIFLVDEGHIEWVRIARRPQDSGFDIVCRHRQDAGQKCPLIPVGSQVGIHKHTATVLTWMLLQWQRDQVAEAAFGHRILIGKQPVIRFEFELASAGAGMADDGGAESARITSGNGAGEENPGVGAVARSRYFKRSRNTQLTTRLEECLGILSPFGLVEIGGEKMAGVVGQQGIDADRALPGEVLVDHLVRKRFHLAMIAVSALDARFLTNAVAPIVRTDRGVA